MYWWRNWDLCKVSTSVHYIIHEGTEYIDIIQLGRKAQFYMTKCQNKSSTIWDRDPLQDELAHHPLSSSWKVIFQLKQKIRKHNIMGFFITLLLLKRTIRLCMEIGIQRNYFVWQHTMTIFHDRSQNNSSEKYP